MSDLISREALLKVIRDDRFTNASDAIYFITNAPAVSGEAVAWYREMPMEYVGNCIEHINEKGEAVYIDFRMSMPPATKGWIPLYTHPQQPDRIAELEERIKSVEAAKARLLEMFKYSESAMRRCDDQFRNAKYAVLWLDAADDCLSDANWFKDVIAEMEGK